MSKLDAQRAMREANYAARNKGQATDQSRGGTTARGTDVLGLPGTTRSGRSGRRHAAGTSR